MKAIKLLLTENVDNLGIVGDVVEVKPGYARNFLLPRGIATKPTPGNIQRLAARRAEVERQMKERRAQLEALLEKLKGHELTLQRSANEQGVLFGGVSQHDISQALQAEGFDVDDRAVRIGQQIKRLDSYVIPIVLANDLRTELKLWVVSDKPLEPGAEAATPAGGEASEVTAEMEEEPAEERPRKKPKAKEAAADSAAAAPAPAADEKPRKKGRKTEDAAQA